MSQLVEQTGFTRQWISREAAKGNVPSARRKPSGRWLFKESPELEDWIASARRITRIARRKRYLHSDERRVSEIQSKLTKIRVNPRSNISRDRLEELHAELAIRKKAVTDSVSTRELAKLVRRSRRWVEMNAASIPGYRSTEKGFKFAKSEELSEWIHLERRLTENDRAMLAGDCKLPRNPFIELSVTTTRFESLIIRTLRNHPLSDWHPSTKAHIQKSFLRLIVTIEQVLKDES